MSHCPNCNKPIPEGSAFCPACGAKAVINPVPTNPGNPRKVHCPQCKSTQLLITTESSVDGAVSNTVGGVTATHVSHVHRNFWVCADCGTKFRNLQNLEEEIVKTKKESMWFSILAVVGLIVALFLFVKASNSFWGETLYQSFGVGALVFAIGMGCFSVARFLKKKKLLAERNYLQAACFD